jgi:predicted metal-dependent hydrolase
LIAGFVADLMFAVKIEEAASRLGYRVQWIENAAQIAPPDTGTPEGQIAEHLVGPGAVLLDRLTLWLPALIIFDLGNQAVPWREWVVLIKTSPATRRIPVICYGPHVEADALRAARSAGADIVLPRSRFARELPELIQRHARVPDYAGLENACLQPLSSLAIKGLELFNQGEYFEAHELLEEAWNEDETPARELYRAVLQAAVAYLQIERGNFNGAMKMFLRLRQWIAPLPDQCRGIDIGQLKADVRQAYDLLAGLGPERIGAFDRRLLKPVRYTLQARP